MARAIEQHLYGQGRAIDVGAFVGYHTIRLAKAAAPHKVYAFEGRPVGVAGRFELSDVIIDED